MFKSDRDYKLYIEDIATECKNIRKFVVKQYMEKQWGY